jgi:hypothetical protein
MEISHSFLSEAERSKSLPIQFETGHLRNLELPCKRA